MHDEAVPSREVAGVLTRPSPLSVAATLARLEAEIARRGLTLFARFDHAANAEAVGMQMPPATVLVFGSPQAGTPLMLASPAIAYELPLRVLVHADSAGHTLVSYADPATLAARYGVTGALVPVLASVGALVGDALRR